jgi:hypothetical protein
MPLTLTEQIDIIERRVAPPNADVELLDLTSAQCYFESSDFMDNHKDVDSGTNPNAYRYLEKMQRLCFKIFQGSTSIVHAVMTVLVTKGAPNTDIATVQALDQSGWENFVSTYSFNGMEYVAGVTKDEKADYDGLS